MVVLGIGAGGTTILRQLNTVGFGRLHAVDFDIIEMSNLATHSAVDEGHVGKAKTKVVEDFLKNQNSEVKVTATNQKFTSWQDLLPHIDDADFVVQAFDKPVGQSASWVNRACIELKKPFASIGQTDKNGRVGNIVVPGKTACSECLGLPEIIIHREHAAAPLTGPCVAILAGILTQEIVKFISGYTESRLLDRSLLIDVDTWEIKAINHAKQDNCPACF